MCPSVDGSDETKVLTTVNKHLFINDYTEQYKVNTLGVKGGSHFSQLHSAFAKILLVVDLSSSLQCEP